MVFLSHPHHRYTQNFQWLLDALGKPFSRIHGDQATLSEFLPSLLHSPPRLLVLFQLEHLAPWCSLFCPVILFPMLDCTRETPDAFLQSLHRVELVSLSRRLHQRLSSLGLSCRHLQYAPDPDLFPEVSWDRGVRGYFWERTPEHLDRVAAGKIFRRLGVPEFEVRSLEDQKFSEGNSTAVRSAAERAWHDHTTYLKYLKDFQVYLSPRRFEGMGLTFLEAMAMGMCVVAENQPTAEEYITAGRNGILYRGEDRGIGLPLAYSFHEMQHMGQQARQHLRTVHHNWLETRGDLSSLVERLSRQTYATTSPTPDGWLEATLNFAKNPGHLRDLVAVPPVLVYRSRRQAKDWGSWWGRLRAFFRSPRQVLLQLLGREGM